MVCLLTCAHNAQNNDSAGGDSHGSNIVEVAADARKAPHGRGEGATRREARPTQDTPERDSEDVSASRRVLARDASRALRARFNNARRQATTSTTAATSTTTVAPAAK